MMVETIVDKLNLCDSMQRIDSYNQKKWLKIFNFFYILSSNNTLSALIIIIAELCTFGQIISLAFRTVDVDNDLLLYIIKSFSHLFLFVNIIKTQLSYGLFYFSIGCLIIVLILLVISIIFSCNCRILFNFRISLLNLINLFLIHFFIGPIIYVCFLITKCNDGIHIYMQVACYSHWKHILCLVLAILYILFYLLYTFTVALYSNKIGSLKSFSPCSRINCNYDIYLLVGKVFMFTFVYLLDLYHETFKYLTIINQILIIIVVIFFSKYSYNTLLYYDKRVMAFNTYGCYITLWIVLIGFLKEVIKFNNASLLLIIGVVLVIISLHYYKYHLMSKYITEINILEVKDIKVIQIFVCKLIKLMDSKQIKDKIILNGLIIKYETLFNMSNTLYTQYEELISNTHLKQKYQMEIPIRVIAIITLIYENHLIKSNIKSDIMLIFGYFLSNYLDNIVYAVSLCSKIKLTNHKQLYLKYVLMEDIKLKELQKLNKAIDTNSIQHIQITSVIQYSHLIEEFKLKIYDAACNQIDYFELLKNKSNVSNVNTSTTFLKLSRNILEIRYNIITIWQQIINLNPFCDDVYKDYMLYLEVIMQDIDLSREETKNYYNNKSSKHAEKLCLYYSLFNKNQSAVLLIDGYSTIKGKIIYGSQNFTILYGYYPKEILNLTVDDLVPNAIKSFHQELINFAIQNSAIHTIYARELDVLLKSKTGGISNVKIWIKVLPNMTHGLIYIIYVSKNHDNHLTIALSNEFKVTDIREINAQINIMEALNSNYGINQSIYGHHIGVVLPNILLHIKFKDQKFILKNSDLDIKGKLYPICHYRDINIKVQLILDLIRQTGSLPIDTNKNTYVHQYQELLNDISALCTTPYSVYYRIIERTFMKGKYTYYRIDFSNNIIGIPDNMQLPNQYTPNDNNSNNSVTHNMTSSKRCIKVKLPSNDNNNQSEKKCLLEKTNMRNTQKNNKNNNIPLSNNNIRELQKHEANVRSINSTQFMAIKNSIIQKKAMVPYTRIIIFSSLYFLITVVLATTLYVLRQDTFTLLSQYLNDNHFFVQSKIFLSCLYMIVINLKMLKHQYVTQDFCLGPCRFFYLNVLQSTIEDIKKIQDDTYTILPEFDVILRKNMNVTVITSHLGESKNVLTTNKNLLGMIISTTYRFGLNSEEYFSGSSGRIDFLADNLIEYIWVISSAKMNNGLNNTRKEVDMNKSMYEITPIPFIFNLFVCLVLFGFIIWYVYVINKMELTFIKQIINFNNDSFDLYLKKIEELQKRLKNDSNDNDDDEDEEKSVSRIDTKSSQTKSEIQDEKFIDNKKKKNKVDNNKEIIDESKYKSKKQKERHKQNKIQNGKNEKIKLITTYFYKLNLGFLLKFILVLGLSMTYYGIVTFLNSTNKKNFIFIDNTMSEVEEIYRQAYLIFLMQKKETYSYFDFELKKEAGIEAFLNNATSVTINNKVYYSIEELKKDFYKISEFSGNLVATPRMGNQILSLIKDQSLDHQILGKLSQLYNGDSCELIFSFNQTRYIHCLYFWSGILTKGIEQTFIYFGTIFDTALKDISEVNSGEKDFKELFTSKSSVLSIECFLYYYLSICYKANLVLFTKLKDSRNSEMHKLFFFVYIGGIVWFIIIYGLLLYFIFLSRKLTSTFLNFIVIFPHQYLSNDDVLYKDIIKLNSNFF